MAHAQIVIAYEPGGVHLTIVVEGRVAHVVMAPAGAIKLGLELASAAEAAKETMLPFGPRKPPPTT